MLEINRLLRQLIAAVFCSGLFFLQPLLAQTPQVIYQETFENYVPQNVTGKSLNSQFLPDTDVPVFNMTNRWTTGHIQGANVNGTKCLYARCFAAACEDAPFYRNETNADLSNSVTRIGFPSSVLPAGAKLSLRFLWRFPRQNADAQAGMKLVYSTDNGSSWKEHPQSFFRTQNTDVAQANLPIDSINFIGFKINSPKLQIGFRWYNFGSVPSDSAIMIDNVQIVFEPKLEIQALSPTSICSGDSLSVAMNISGFPTGTSFSAEYSQDPDFGASTTLSPNPVFSATPVRPSLNGSRKVRIPLSTITGSYFVRISSSSGIFSDALPLTITKTPDKPFAGSETSVCSGADPITVGSPNGEDEVSYTWNVQGPNGFLTESQVDLPTEFLTNNSLTKITKPVIVTASSGEGACVVQSDPMLVNIFPNPQISLAEGFDTMCQDGVQILRFLVQPKCPYSLSVPCQSQSAQCFINSPNASKFQNNDTAFVFNSAGLQPGNQNLTYRHTFRWISTLACSTDYDFTVGIAERPQSEPGNPETFCQGDTAKLLVFPALASGLVSRWEGSGVSPNGLFNPSAITTPIPSNPGFININLRRIVTKITGTVSCSDTSVKVVTIRKRPKPSPGLNPETICESTGELLLSNFSPVGAGSGPLNAGKWSGPGITGTSAGINSPSPKFVVSNSTSQANILTYTYTDLFGCTGDTTKTVFVLPNPPASAGNDRPSCSGQAVQIGSPPVPDFGYKWLSPPAQFFVGSTTSSTARVKLFNTGANPDTVLGILQVLDSTSGCKSKDTLLIIVFPVPNANLQLPPVSQACTGDTIMLRSNIAGLDTSKLNFQWLRNNFAITLPNQISYAYPTTVSGSYQIIIGYQGVSCFDTSTAVQVNFNPVIKPKIVGDRTFCGNSPTTLRAVPADPAYLYEWKFYRFKPDTNLIAPPPVLLPGIPIAGVEVSRRGLLRVTLRTERGCADTSDLVQIDSLPRPEITNTINDTAFCNNVQALFQAPVDSSPFYNYRWLDSSNRNIILSDSSKFYPKVAGTYYLEIYNKCGIATDTFRVIQVIPAPQFGILAGGRRDTSVCLNQNNSFDLVAPPGFQTYEWFYQDPVSDKAEGPIKSRILSNLPVSLDTNYRVKLLIRDQFGCFNEDTIRVFVAQCQPRLFVPNAFLPTSNPLTEQEESNRVWFFDGYGIAEAKWYIYNRWGEMVASGNNWGQPQSPSDGRGWDGSFQKSGLPCPTGTYKYLIEYKGQKDNVTKKLAGNLTLIR